MTKTNPTEAKAIIVIGASYYGNPEAYLLQNTTY